MTSDTKAAEAASKRPRLAPATVLDLAVAVADAEGLEAVTIRRLAEDLGVTPMALYWHFRNKDELLDGLVARVLAEVDLAVSAGPWQQQFAALAHAMVTALRAHPWIAGLLIGRDCRSEGYLEALEAMLDVLRRGGFDPAEATAIARHALSTAIALVDSPWMRGGAGQDEAARRRSQQALESLPRERFPRIVEAAAPLTSCDGAGRGRDLPLELLLAGVNALAPR